MGIYVARSTIKIKSRSIERKLKDGTIKEYTFYESHLKLPKSHHFKNDEEVVILNHEEYDKMIEGYATSIQELKKSHEKEKDDLKHTHDVLENKYHSQEKRLEKAFKDQNELEQRIYDLENQGIWDKLRNRIKLPALLSGKE